MPGERNELSSCVTHPLWEGRLPNKQAPLTEGPRWAAQPANGMRRSKAPKEPPSRTDEENEEYQQLLADSQDYEDMLAQVRAWYERKALDEEVKAALAVEAQRINELIALKEEDRKRRTQEAESPASAAPPSNKQRQSKAKGGKLTRQAREAQLINQMIAVVEGGECGGQEERRVQTRSSRSNSGCRLRKDAGAATDPHRSGAGMGHLGCTSRLAGASTRPARPAAAARRLLSFADSDTPTELTKASARGLPSSSHAAHDAWLGLGSSATMGHHSCREGGGGGGSVPSIAPPSPSSSVRPAPSIAPCSTMSDAAVAEER